jgi:hypothetical protein
MICEEVKKPENKYEAASTLLGSERPFGQVHLLWQIFGLEEEEVVESDDDDDDDDDDVEGNEDREVSEGKDTDDDEESEDDEDKDGD